MIFCSVCTFLIEGDETLCFRLLPMASSSLSSGHGSLPQLLSYMLVLALVKYEIRKERSKGDWDIQGQTKDSFVP